MPPASASPVQRSPALPAIAGAHVEQAPVREPRARREPGPAGVGPAPVDDRGWSRRERAREHETPALRDGDAPVAGPGRRHDVEPRPPRTRPGSHEHRRRRSVEDVAAVGRPGDAGCVDAPADDPARSPTLGAAARHRRCGRRPARARRGASLRPSRAGPPAAAPTPCTRRSCSSTSRTGSGAPASSPRADGGGPTPRWRRRTRPERSRTATPRLQLPAAIRSPRPEPGRVADAQSKDSIRRSTPCAPPAAAPWRPPVGRRRNSSARPCGSHASPSSTRRPA